MAAWYLMNREDEVRDGYLVTSETKQLWNAELNILAEIDSICRKHGIKYWVDYGSLLGAVRHKGFIPWDDDLDLGMLRSDYERFRQVAQTELPENLFFQSIESDPDYFIGNACVRKNGTAAVMQTWIAINGRMMYRFHQGISVDIIIYDNVPDDVSIADAFVDEVRLLRSDSAYREFVAGVFRARDLALAKKDFPLFLSHCYRGIRYWLEKVILRRCGNRQNSKDSIDFAKRYQFFKTSFIAPLTTMPYGAREKRIDKSIFDDIVFVDFEKIKVPIPRRYDERLRICYGEWRKPIKNASAHKGMFFKVNQSYIDYFTKKIPFD